MAENKNEGEGGQAEFRSDDFTSELSSDFGALTGGKSDSSLGNLPPLSDFDSDDAGSKGGGLSGLPPLSDIEMTTPMPTGGNIKPAPAEFPSGSAFDTPLSDPGLKLDTPLPPRKSPSGMSFQDLAADSDFSPETPEIGPGPDSDLETPMFDSAFGGGDFSNTSTPDTSAPTQAMETPMFGVPKSGPPRGGNVGFDDDAFGADFLGGGTPAPDLSPDTAIPGPAPMPTPAAGLKESKKAAKAARGGDSGGGGMGKTIIAAAIALVIGVLAGPFLAEQLSFMPYPVLGKLAETQKNFEDLDLRLKKATSNKGAEGASLTPEAMDELLKQKEQLDADIAALTTSKTEAETKAGEANSQLQLVQQDLANLTDQFVQDQAKFDELQNQTAIISARQEGLLSEVDRLQGMVGTLEDANARQVASKESLSSAVGRLEIQVREGIPLTPEKYDIGARKGAIEELKGKIDAAKWVTPEVVEAYATVLGKELEIAASREYFFAKVPVSDRFGTNSLKWAECLMNGNWSVYYRTLDGHNIGVYEKKPDGSKDFAFREEFPADVKNAIEETIFASRTPGYEDKLRVLVDKQLVSQPETDLQRVFSSL